MAQYLNEVGLAYFWKKIIGKFAKAPNVAQLDYMGTIPVVSGRSGLQGGCYIGSNHYACYVLNPTPTLFVFSLVDGSIVNSAVMDLGHGNSLTFNANTNKIYSYGAFSGSPTVTVIDATTLAIDNTFDLSGMPIEFSTQTWGYALAYDSSLDRYYAIGQSWSGNKSTVNKAQGYIVTFDSEFTYLSHAPLPSRVGGGIINFTAHNGKLYFVYNNPEQLVVYDTDFNVFEHIIFEQLVSGCSYLQEIESVSVIDEELVFSYVNGASDNFCFARLRSNRTSQTYNLGNEFSNVCECYVNYDNSTFVQNGTSESPFGTMTAAISLAAVYDHVIIHDVTTTQLSRGALFSLAVGDITIDTTQKVEYNLQGIGNITLSINVMRISNLSVRKNCAPIITIDGFYSWQTSIQNMQIRGAKVYISGDNDDVGVIDIPTLEAYPSAELNYKMPKRIGNASLVQTTLPTNNGQVVHGCIATKASTGINTLHGAYIPSRLGLIKLYINSKWYTTLATGGADGLIVMDNNNSMAYVNILYTRTGGWLKVNISAPSSVTISNWEYERL